LIAGIILSSADAVSEENMIQCSADGGETVGGTCYDATISALDGAETSFGQANMTQPFVDACEFLVNPPITEAPTAAPTPTPAPTPDFFRPRDCPLIGYITPDECAPTNSTCNAPETYFEDICQSTEVNGNKVPECIPCSRLNGFYMAGDAFVNISDYSGVGYIHNPEFACAAGYQCVATDPYDALPESDSFGDVQAKAPGCCQKCLNGQSCPPMTVAPTGYYFDNLCPDGHKCDVGEWPVPCSVGEICYKGVQINCTTVVESVREGASGNSLDAVAGVGGDGNQRSNGTTYGFLDGAYCEGGPDLGWCPGGYYCPNPQEKYICPKGYFCPPKTRFYEFKCNDEDCGPGEIFNSTQTKVQLIVAVAVASLGALLLTYHYITKYYDRQNDAKRFEERRINNMEKDFLVSELISLRIHKKMEQEKAAALQAERRRGSSSFGSEHEALDAPSDFTPTSSRVKRVTAAIFGTRAVRGARAPGRNKFQEEAAAAAGEAGLTGSGRKHGSSIRKKSDSMKSTNTQAMDIAKKHMARKKSERDEDDVDEDEDDFQMGSYEDLESGASDRMSGGGILQTFRKATVRTARKATKITPVITNTNVEGKVEVEVDEEDLMAMGVPTYDEIKEIFESIDKDGDGLITLPELKATKLGQHLSEKELQKIMDGTLDENKHAAKSAPVAPLARRGSVSAALGGISSSLSSIRAGKLGGNLNTFQEEMSPKSGEIRMPKAMDSHDHHQATKSEDHGAVLERRQSFVNSLQKAFVDSDAPQVTHHKVLSKAKKAGGHSKGITFEEFSKQFFELMTAKVKDEGIISDPNVKGVELDFKDVNLFVKVAGKEFQVLKDVNGKIEQKSMVALMGGSGAGKTSLLNTLCGRAFYATKISGTLKINGKVDRMENYQDIIGFVPQDDIVHGDLTVYENLLYSGLFRLPCDTPMEDIEDLADQILEELQMTHIRDSLVGDADKRGISGGQRKRVNIGWELMARPKLLFLDEPTSGLDAASSSVALAALKRLAKRGTTVVTVIHQPRYSIFEMFDNVLLLGKGGQVAFQGKPKLVVPYFQDLGFKLPFGENPADWMLDITSGSLKSEKSKKDAADTFDTRINFLFSTWKDYEAKQKPENPAADATSKEPGHSLRDDLDAVNPPGVLGQYLLFLERSYVQRSRKFIIIALDMFLIVGSAYMGASISGNYRPIQPDFEVLDIPAAAILNMTLPGAERVEYPLPFMKSFEMANEYAMITNLLFVILLTLSSLRSFGDNKLLFYREAGSGFSVTAFFLSQLTLDQLLFSIQALWAAIASYELRTSLVPLWSHIWLYQLTAFFCSGWAYIFSLVVPRANLVMFSALFVSICGTMLSGSLTFLRYTDIYASGFMSVFVGMLSSTRWFTEWMIVSEFRSLPAQYGFTSDKLDYFRLAGYGLGDIDNARTQGDGGWYYNVVPMLCVGLGLRIVCYSLIITQGRKKMNKRSLWEEATGSCGGFVWAVCFGLIPLLVGFGGSAFVIHSYAAGVRSWF
jgi:ABC-type multidrug transport system ATPase subunit